MNNVIIDNITINNIEEQNDLTYINLEDKEFIRKRLNRFKINDRVMIVAGRFMKGEIKEIRYIHHIIIHKYIHYDRLIFTDGTTTYGRNCIIL